MKEKRDQCILVGYSTQSKGYRVYNKRTRMIVESIHVRFEKIKEVSETFVANNTSGLVPQRQKASDYDNPDPVPQRQDVYSLADADVPSQQELDMLFGPLVLRIFLENLPEHPSDTKVFTMKMEILLEPTSNKLLVGANNNINVLDNTPLFDDLLNDTALVLPYVVNGVGYEIGYYLADGIYPQWATFVKCFTVANDAKHAYFKKRQEGARKDVEHAFGVLQGRWRIIQQPARSYHVNTLRRVMYSCIILHNMILKIRR
nr:hypothetical protein [Tanacetum cinerariifolium]